MESTIRAYTKVDKKSCIAAFESNIPPYFATEEINDFEEFLLRIEKEDNQTPFYVVVYGDKVIGCGGFGDKDNNHIISLAWGLIHNDYHKKGFGEKLLLYRFEQIKKRYPLEFLDMDLTSYKGSLEYLKNLRQLKAITLPRVSTVEVAAFKRERKDCIVVNGYEFE